MSLNYTSSSESEDNMDIPSTCIDQIQFKWFVSSVQQQEILQDVILANRVVQLGYPNKLGCRIPLVTNWRLNEMELMLLDYHDKDVIEWLRFGFTISREDTAVDPTPNNINHLRATLFPAVIDEYVEKEVRLGVAIGPFTVPPFLHRIGISPLSTRPKKDSDKRRIILDLSFPEGSSVNNGINKDYYCGEPIKLVYPSIDNLARRVAMLGQGALLWKRDTGT